jgi:hypothetical protein
MITQTMKEMIRAPVHAAENKASVRRLFGQPPASRTLGRRIPSATAALQVTEAVGVGSEPGLELGIEPRVVDPGTEPLPIASPGHLTERDVPIDCHLTRQVEEPLTDYVPLHFVRPAGDRQNFRR